MPLTLPTGLPMANFVIAMKLWRKAMGGTHPNQVDPFQVAARAEGFAFAQSMMLLWTHPLRQMPAHRSYHHHAEFNAL
jgi:hypothetical protein